MCVKLRCARRVVCTKLRCVCKVEVVMLFAGFPDPEFSAVPRDSNAGIGRCVLHGTVLSR